MWEGETVAAEVGVLQAPRLARVSSTGNLPRAIIRPEAGLCNDIAWSVVCQVWACFDPQARRRGWRVTGGDPGSRPLLPPACIGSQGIRLEVVACFDPQARRREWRVTGGDPTSRRLLPCACIGSHGIGSCRWDGVDTLVEFGVSEALQRDHSSSGTGHRDAPMQDEKLGDLEGEELDDRSTRRPKKLGWIMRRGEQMTQQKLAAGGG